MGRILFILLFLFPYSLTAQLEEAFQLYNSGKYEQAATIYQNYIHQKGKSADLLYNLGLCFLSAKKIPAARLAFEQANLLSPDFKHVQNLINSINARVEPRIESLPDFLPVHWFRSIRDLLNSNGWSVISILIAWILAYFIFKCMMSNQSMLNKRNLVLACIFLFSLGLYFSRIRLENAPYGIILTNESLSAAPTEKSQELLPLGAGTKFLIVDSLNTFFKVKLDNNDLGWLPKNKTIRY